MFSQVMLQGLYSSQAEVSEKGLGWSDHAPLIVDLEL